MRAGLISGLRLQGALSCRSGLAIRSPLILDCLAVSATPHSPASLPSAFPASLPAIAAGSPEDRFLALFARLVIERLLTEHHAGAELSAPAAAPATATASAMSSFLASKSHKGYLQ